MKDFLASFFTGLACIIGFAWCCWAFIGIGLFASAVIPVWLFVLALVPWGVLAVLLIAVLGAYLLDN